MQERRVRDFRVDSTLYLGEAMIPAGRDQGGVEKYLDSELLDVNTKVP